MYPLNYFHAIFIHCLVPGGIYFDRRDAVSEINTNKSTCAFHRESGRDSSRVDAILVVLVFLLYVLLRLDLYGDVRPVVVPSCNMLVILGLIAYLT